MTKYTILLAALLSSAAALGADLPEFHLTIKDAKFNPNAITIPANQKIKLVVKNEGPTAEEFESTDLNREKVVAPGKTVTILIGPLKAGTYSFFSDFHRDTANGQIIVK